MCGGHCKDCKALIFSLLCVHCADIFCLCVLKINFCACKSKRDILREIALNSQSLFIFFTWKKLNVTSYKWDQTLLVSGNFIQRPLRKKTQANNGGICSIQIVIHVKQWLLNTDWKWYFYNKRGSYLDVDRYEFFSCRCLYLEIRAAYCRYMMLIFWARYLWQIFFI